ncbi:MAG: hypothetical protein IT389_06155 [Nitrospira sp.]|nr:hypothetical protein [Nitrospira sp.]
MNDMKNDSINQILVKTIKGLEGCFDKKRGELAYLALTSKPEFVIRDRLAWELHNKQLPPEFIVAREWKRIDIAILRKQDKPTPASLIQLKTWSLFTFIDEAQKHFLEVCKDIDKCEKKGKECLVYALVLATHIGARLPDKRYDGVVKYRRGWGKAIKDHGSSEKVKAQAIESTIAALKNFKLYAERGEIEAGKAFGAKVSILYWLIQKK